MPARLITAIATGMVAVAAAASAAGAPGPVDVVVDSTDIQLAAATGGTQTGKVTLSNIRRSPVNVAARIVGPDGGCSITPAPSSVASGRRTVVTLTFGTSCELDDGADVRLALTPNVSPPGYVLKVMPATKAEANWDILVYAFLIGLGVATVLVLSVAGWIARHNRKKEDSKKIAWNDPLKYLGTSWSFKDNWVGNVTIGSAALVALLAASNVLEAVLGKKPEAALGLLAVASALAAAFVAIGPLVIKVIGSDMTKPTVVGMLVAALVTLVGTVGQITAVTWQGAELTSGSVKIGVVVLGALVGGVVLAYAGRALWGYALSGSEPPATTPSEVATGAQIIATAIRATWDPNARDQTTRGVDTEEGAAAMDVAELPVSPEQRNALL